MNNVETIIIKTFKASSELRRAPEKNIISALKDLARSVRDNSELILRANKKDLLKQKPEDPKTDRLMLNKKRIDNPCQLSTFQSV